MSDHQLPVADRAEVRRALWRLVRGDGRAMSGVLLLTGLAAAAGLAAPWLLGELVNDVEAGTAGSTVDTITLAVVGFALAQLVLTRYARYAAHRFGEWALARLREEFVDRVLALPTAVVERAGTGDLMTRAAGDVSTVGTTVRDAAPEVLIGVVRVVFVLAAVFVLNPLLGLCGLVGVPLLTAVARWYLRRAREAYLAEGAANSDVAESLAATAEGGRTVEAFGLGERRVALGDARIAAAFRARVRTLRLRSVLFPVADVAHALPTALCLLVGAVVYDAGLVPLGAVVAASLYFWQLVEPMDSILNWMEQLQRSGASFARLIGVGSAVDTARTAEYGVPADDRITVSGVHFAYRPGQDVLVDVDLDVRPGERLAVVGPSGAGKSTLGRLLAGVDSPRLGAVTIGGVPATDLAPEDLRRRVQLVTQEHHVFLGTLRDNLSIAAPDADDATIRAALDTVDADWVGALPSGLDTELGPDGVTLDAAGAQQLALARVVLADPHTLILDEATAALDPATARHAERSLGRVLAGRTVIAIAHRLHTAHYADRVAVMDAGRVVELGAHDELVRAEGSYAALWRSWHGSAAGPGSSDGARTSYPHD